jgi:TolA-binding protein
MKRRLAIVAALALVALATAPVSPVLALDEADRLYLVGERATADRFFAVARRALERFVAAYPDDARQPRALLMLGQARLNLNDTESALEALRRAQSGLTAPAEVQEAKFWQAEALFRLKRFSEARTTYDEIVRTNAAGPLAPAALYGYGWSELELKRPEPAITAFRDFLTTWPDHALAPSVTLQLAAALVDAKRVSEALPLLAGFAAKFSSSKLIPDAQYELGWVKYNNGDRQGGLADLQAFVDANPNHPKAAAARQVLAQGLARYGNRQQRLSVYQSLMAQTPPTADAYYEAGAIAASLGLKSEQEAAWRKLRTEFPNDERTRKMAGDRAADAFKRKSWKDAVELGTIAGQSDDDTVKAEGWLTVGEAELQQKRYTSAVKAFEAVVGVKDVEASTKFRALAGLGLAREELKEYKGALVAYEAVAKQSPDATLRQWAQERASAVRPMANKPGNGSGPKPARPADKPGSKKS